MAIYIALMAPAVLPSSWRMIRSFAKFLLSKHPSEQNILATATFLCVFIPFCVFIAWLSGCIALLLGRAWGLISGVATYWAVLFGTAYAWSVGPVKFGLSASATALLYTGAFAVLLTKSARSYCGLMTRPTGSILLGSLLWAALGVGLYFGGLLSAPYWADRLHEISAQEHAAKQ